MPLRVGLVVYPLLPLILIGAKRGAVSKYVKAGATSPETARRPMSLNADSNQVESAVRRGVMIPLGDGRYFVDPDAYRRRHRRMVMWFMIGFTLLTAFLLWLWPPWSW